MKAKPDRVAIVSWSIIGIVLTVCLSFSCWYGHYSSSEKNIFSSITNDPVEAVRLVNQASRRNHQTTIVMVKSTCADCRQAHNAIITSVKQARKDGHSVLVFDADHLTSRQVYRLTNLVPSLKNPTDGRVHTPTFTTVKLVKSGFNTYLMATKTLIEGNNAAISNYFKGVNK